MTGLRVPISLKGADALRYQLSLLDAKVARQISMRALRAGANLIRDAAIQRAPVETGAGRGGIRVGRGKRRRRNVLGMAVYTSEGKRGEAYDPFYLSFIEFGWEKVPTYRGPDGRIYSKKRGSKPVTVIPPRPFFRPAFDATHAAALRRIRAEMWAGIAAEATKSAAAIRKSRG